MIAKKEIAQDRYEICKYCPRINSLKICTICNCIMPIKVKFAKASCPAGKWTSADQTQQDDYILKV